MLTKFTVKRSNWLRAPYHEYDNIFDSALLLGEDMCCLGFYCEQSGIAKSGLNSVQMPGALGPIQKNRVPALISEDDNNSDLAEKAAKINDDIEITDKERECKLTELFSKHGITINFED